MLSLLVSPLGIGCSLCMPCTTPPCYKQDGDYTYTSNGPGNWYSSVSPCWFQKALNANKQTINGVAIAGGRPGEECYCSGDKYKGGPTADWTETNIRPTFVDSLNRQQYGEWKYRHRHCAPIEVTLPQITPDAASGLQPREFSGGQSSTYMCGCSHVAARTFLSQQARADLAEQLTPDDPRYVHPPPKPDADE